MPEPDSTTGRPRALSILIENPAYRWFYAGQGASLIGTWAQEAAVGWVVYDLTKSTSIVGLVDAAETLPGLVVGLVAGLAADRVAPRPMILGMQAGQMLMAFLLVAIVGGGSVQVWQLAIILAVSQVFVSFEEPSRQVFQRKLVGRTALTHAVALESGLFNAARVLGPAVAGIGLALSGRSAPFALNAVSFLAAIGALMIVRMPGSADEGEAEAEAADEPAGGLFAGLAHLRHDRRSRWTFLMLAFFGVVGMSYTALMPAYARTILHTAERGYCVLQVSGGVGSTAGAFLVAAVASKRRRDRLIPGGMVVMGVSLAAAALLPSVVQGNLIVAIAAACMFGAGMGTVVVFTLAQTLIQAAVPDTIRGRVMGLWMIVYSASFPIGACSAGFLATPLGVVAVMVGAATLCVVVGLAVGIAGVLKPTEDEARSAGEELAAEPAAEHAGSNA